MRGIRTTKARNTTATTARVTPSRVGSRTAISTSVPTTMIALLIRPITAVEAAWFSSTVSEVTRRSEEHTSELQSRGHLVCRLLLEKKKHKKKRKLKIIH